MAAQDATALDREALHEHLCLAGRSPLAELLLLHRLARGTGREAAEHSVKLPRGALERRVRLWRERAPPSRVASVRSFGTFG